MQNTSRTNTNYSDLDLNFTIHPVTHDISKKVGDEAIKRSIRNLVLTNFWDRPFRSHIGSNVPKMLFENINSTTARLIAQNIEDVIKNFEPRASLLKVDVSVSDSNELQIDIQFTTLNSLLPLTTTIFLERVR